MSRIKTLSTALINRLAKGKSFFVGFGLAIGIVFGTAFQGGGGGTKVGFVDTESVIAQMPESKVIQEKLKRITDGWQSEFDKLKKDYTDAADDYEKKSALLAPAEKQKKEEELQAKQQRLQEFQQKKLGQGGELQQKQVELLKPLETRVIAAIESVAKSNGYAIVLSRGGQVNTVLYGDKTNDLTFKVLDKLNAGK